MSGLEEVRKSDEAEGILGLATTYLEESVRCIGGVLKYGDNSSVLEAIVNAISSSLIGDGKALFAGNGGSFADSQHIAAEFVSKLMFDRDPLPAIALGTNSSSVTAIANDYGFEQVFKRELTAVGSSRDTLVALSTSGNSPNIVELVKTAQSLGIQTFGLTGSGDGVLPQLCPCIEVPSCHTAHIQETHIALGHLICFLVEGLVLPKP